MDIRTKDLDLARVRNVLVGLHGSELSHNSQVDPDTLREMIDSILPTNSEKNSFAVNYSIPPAAFIMWVQGRIDSPASERAALDLVLTGSLPPVPFSITAARYMTLIPPERRVLIYGDGDNMSFKAAPLFPLCVSWGTEIVASLYYRRDSLPPFIRALQTVYSLATELSPVLIVRSYSVTKDAADVDYCTNSMVTAGKRLEPNYPNRLFALVSNDKITNEMVFMAKDLLRETSRANDEVVRYDQRRVDLSKRFVIEEFAQNDEFVGNVSSSGRDTPEAHFSDWFINLIHNVHFPVPERYREIVQQIRARNNLEAFIRSQPDPARRYTLYQQYLVLTCQKFITSDDLRHYFMQTGLYGIVNTAQRNVFGAATATKEAIDYLNTTPVDDVLKGLYGVLNYVQALQFNVVKAALNVAEVSVPFGTRIIGITYIVPPT